MKIIKVHFENRFIALSPEPDRLQKYSIFHKYHDERGLYDLIREFSGDQSVQSLNIYCTDIDNLWLRFKGYFNIAEAAGGLVKHPSNNFLFIKRYGKWDLPKGHIEPGETPEECALREIEEECGITEMKIIKPLLPSYHTYQLNNVNYLKPTYWFLVDYRGPLIVNPNGEEGITDGKWMPPSSIQEIRSNTWTSLIDLLNNSIRPV